jgi:predicted permease
MWFQELTQNVRYSLRTLRRSPLFTATAILSLALGIGANTAVFSFMRAIVLRELPVPGSSRLALVRMTNEQFHMENCCFRYDFFQKIRREAPGFEEATAISTPSTKYTDRDQSERLTIELVTGDYFRFMGVRAVAGRLFDENDDAVEGAAAVAVISHRFWMDRYAGDPGVIGRRVLLEGQPFQIIGVTQPGFTGASLHEPHDVQVPSAMASTFFGEQRDRFGWLQVLARLKPGVTRAAAESQIQVAGRRIYTGEGWQMSPRDRFLLKDGTQGLDSRKEEFGKPVQVLMLLVGVVLLVACANLAALLLVRGVQRTREAGVRLALGASRGALVKRFLTESLLVAIGGGIAGFWVAQALSRILLAMLGTSNAQLATQIGPDAGMFMFTAGVTIAAGLLFGTLPAWRTSHADPIQAIHGIAGSGKNPRRQSFATRVLMAAQIALSLALVFGAGLFSRTLANLRSVDLGFHPENVIVMSVDIGNTPAAKNGKEVFFDELMRRVNDLPETRAASYADLVLLSGSMQSVVIKVPEYVSPTRMMPVTKMLRTTPGFFRSVGLPIVDGREFTREDRDKDDKAVVVNQQFAKQFLNGRALGKTFQYGGGRKVHVVGVAVNTKYQQIKESPEPIMYLPVMLSNVPDSLNLHVRTSGAAPAMIERLRGIVRDMERTAVIGEPRTFAMEIDQALSRERLLAFLSTLLGGLALALAAIGLYGVLSFSVARRTREIGIRMAIGAQKSTVLGMFLRESLWTVLAGVAAGIPLALGCGKLASSLLYGLQGQDPTTAGLATVVLALVAFGAAIIPAARAARVDPIRALRHE